MYVSGFGYSQAHRFYTILTAADSVFSQKNDLYFTPFVDKCVYLSFYIIKFHRTWSTTLVSVFVRNLVEKL